MPSACAFMSTSWISPGSASDGWVLARGFSVRAAVRATLLACWDGAGRVEEDMLLVLMLFDESLKILHF